MTLYQYILIWLLAFAFLVCAVRLLAQVAGHGWETGRRNAELRAPVFHHPSRRGVRALGYGGVCVEGHYVGPGGRACRMGHGYSPATTQRITYAEWVGARDWAIRKGWVPANVPPVPVRPIIPPQRRDMDTLEMDTHRAHA